MCHIHCRQTYTWLDLVALLVHLYWRSFLLNSDDTLQEAFLHLEILGHLCNCELQAVICLVQFLVSKRLV